MQYIFLILMYVILVFIDQITKHLMYVISNAQFGYSIPVLGDFFKLTYIENHGGVFGVFQGHIIVFTIMSTFLIGYIVYTEWENFLKSNLIKKIAIMFIAAGATGNMIDRFFRGYVIDMIDFRGIWQFIFNVADVYIHIGIYILILIYLLKKEK
ncbi:signal peptidase II [Streptobacillus moniliformis]|uniref:Lipoprotein signal peptidase n=1 Tax=Streptobacillus moniliformis (strain ATCC 14647 / DSM 12112 / NCTC 10651 / 9901) TaxID=519441 RepID=D1AUZ5_STRM9|nr:signal peptidase II [Streptobacillus moniliformis]ACZ01555.1 lipoprotein signal peptidase [Streptobacillus moniliformis DSM 12112]AVL43447.1 signal peptidase II [Streptobacillus moniliformis]SQA13278.1 Lipoprotein signal peptidase [Streptobacillus moniliformis]